MPHAMPLPRAARLRATSSVGGQVPPTTRFTNSMTTRCTILGFDRSEISSVAAEMAGDAEPTWLRAIDFAKTPDRRYRTAYDHSMAARELRCFVPVITPCNPKPRI